MPQDNPFLEIDLYLIADFGIGKRSWASRNTTSTL